MRRSVVAVLLLCIAAQFVAPMYGLADEPARRAEISAPSDQGTTYGVSSPSENGNLLAPLRKQPRRWQQAPPRVSGTATAAPGLATTAHRSSYPARSQLRQLAAPRSNDPPA